MIVLKPHPELIGKVVEFAAVVQDDAKPHEELFLRFTDGSVYTVGAPQLEGHQMQIVVEAQP